MTVFRMPARPHSPGSIAASPRAFPMRDAPKSIRRQATVLVVDDDPSNVELYCRVLGRMGHGFRKACDGAEALGIYRKGGIDLVLSDFQMPRMGGLELLREIRARDPDARVIILSGGMRREERAELLRSGAAMLLSKPVSVLQLEDAIRANL